MLAPGSYVVELVATPVNAFGGRVTRKITIASAPREEKVDFGYVEAGPNKLIQPGTGPATKRVVLEVGPRRVMVKGAPGSEEAAHTASVIVKPGATVIAN